MTETKNSLRYAIIQTGGKQYQAIEGRTLAIEKIDANPGDQVTFSEVLLCYLSDEDVQIGQPFLATPVVGSVIKHARGPKLIVFKFRRRKKSKRKLGHRQPFTVIRVERVA